MGTDAHYGRYLRAAIAGDCSSRRSEATNYRLGRDARAREEDPTYRRRRHQFYASARRYRAGWRLLAPVRERARAREREKEGERERERHILYIGILIIPIA